MSTMETIFIIDTETASLTSGVVELAYLELDHELNILQEFCERVNPERPIDPGAQAIHGISDADVAGCRTLAEVTTNFVVPVVYVGHNCAFDLRMTTPRITAKQMLCTLALSREYVKGTTNHKLATLQLELGLPTQQSHSALGDVHTTRDLLLHILQLAGLPLQTLLDRANMPKLLRSMPFGKHKGVSILKTPKDYRAWLLNQDGLDKDLRYTLEKFATL